MVGQTFTCSKCGTLKVRIQSGTNVFGEPRYVDELDRAWSCRTCPGCLSARRAKRNKSPDLSTTPTIIKGRRAERTVERYLIANGYTDIVLTTGIGPDITCTPPNEANRITIEVKSVSSSGNQWWVSRISQSRINDDFLAIALPGDKVAMFKLAEFLAGRNWNSKYTITNLVKEHCPELFPSKPSVIKITKPNNHNGFSYARAMAIRSGAA